MREFFKRYKILLILPIILIGPIAILEFFSFEHSYSFGLLLSIVFLWLTEYIPLPATALLIPIVSAALGLVSIREAFRPFGNQILFLFIGSFLLAEGMQKHGLDRRMSYYILSKKYVSRSLSTIVIVISLMAWVLSMWISNTASCVVLYPICIALIKSLESQFTTPLSYQNFKLRILFTCAFAASIGGMATPIGSPPNLLALNFLSQKGINISFLDWMLLGVPISFVMLLSLNFLLAIKFPLEVIDLKKLRFTFIDELKKLGKISDSEVKVGLCFMLAVFLWVFPGFLKNFDLNSQTTLEIGKKLSMGLVAIVSASILFVLPSNKEGKKVLEIADIKKIDWGTIILFGGGLCLGTVMSSSGLASYLGKIIFSTQAADSLAMALVISVGLSIVLSELGSNTASAAIVLPLLLVTFRGVTDSVLIDLIMATTFAASLGFILPVATPPNAIIYGSGEISLKQMVKTGISFDLIGFLLICTVFIIRITFFK